MIGHSSASPSELHDRVGALPGIAAVRDAAAAEGVPAYLVGGAVRDLLLGLDRTDVDVVVEGDAAAVARRIGGEVVEHERFRTATARVEGQSIDLATARAESYPAPGALPEVRPATLAEDLARRDFTINAMAVSLGEAADLVDPYGGRADLDRRLLRILHDRSFVDDPTRALRAARYAARLGLAPEPQTAALLGGADLSTVSAERVRAELLRLAGEGNAHVALELLAKWDLLETPPAAFELACEVARLASSPPWAELVDRAAATVATLDGLPERSAALAAARPRSPSEGYRLAAGASPVELVIGRAAGATWLDDHVARWRHVRLEIDGRDLVAAGVPEGPAVGRGLDGALALKLDGELDGREAELAAALKAAAGEG